VRHAQRPGRLEQARGEHFDLALARRKATDPSKRIGSLVVNPGGPGGSGVDFVLLAPDYFSADLRARFDLVGFDPRGVARSHPVLCSVDLLSAAPSPVPTNQAEFDRLSGTTATSATTAGGTPAR
jgi:pimeloyl-ACP methyl ester carboxylesterase